jgi:hypothetical protein
MQLDREALGMKTAALQMSCGECRVHAYLGQGSSATVYSVVHPETGLLLVAKIFRVLSLVF